MIFKFVYYEDTTKLKNILRSLKQYNKVAYKQLILKENFEELEFKKYEKGIYKADLFTDKLFEKVYGKCRVVAEIRNKQIKIITVEPERFFLDGYQRLLDTYKGIPYRTQKDLFKIKLAERIKDDI